MGSIWATVSPESQKHQGKHLPAPTGLPLSREGLHRLFLTTCEPLGFASRSPGTAPPAERSGRPFLAGHQASPMCRLGSWEPGPRGSSCVTPLSLEHVLSPVIPSLNRESTKAVGQPGKGFDENLLRLPRTRTTPPHSASPRLLCSVSSSAFDPVGGSL